MQGFIKEFEDALAPVFAKYEKQAALHIPAVWDMYCEGLVNQSAVLLVLYEFQNERESKEWAMRIATGRIDPFTATTWASVDAPLTAVQR